MVLFVQQLTWKNVKLSFTQHPFDFKISILKDFHRAFKIYHVSQCSIIMFLIDYNLN